MCVASAEQLSSVVICKMPPVMFVIRIKFCFVFGKILVAIVVKLVVAAVEISVVVMKMFIAAVKFTVSIGVIIVTVDTWSGGKIAGHPLAVDLNDLLHGPIGSAIGTKTGKCLLLLLPSTDLHAQYASFVRCRQCRRYHRC